MLHRRQRAGKETNPCVAMQAHIRNHLKGKNSKEGNKAPNEYREANSKQKKHSIRTPSLLKERISRPNSTTLQTG